MAFAHSAWREANGSASWPPVRGSGITRSSAYLPPAAWPSDFDPYGLNEHAQDIARRCGFVGHRCWHIPSLLDKMGDESAQAHCVSSSAFDPAVKATTMPLESLLAERAMPRRRLEPGAAGRPRRRSFSPRARPGTPRGIEYSHRQMCLAASCHPVGLSGHSGRQPPGLLAAAVEPLSAHDQSVRHRPRGADLSTSPTRGKSCASPRHRAACLHRRAAFLRKTLCRNPGSAGEAAAAWQRRIAAMGLDCR